MLPLLVQNPLLIVPAVQQSSWGTPATVEPPWPHPADTLPTIPEQPNPAHYPESHDDYSEPWPAHHHQSPAGWERPQSQTLTPQSVPTSPPPVSISEAAAVAQIELQKSQKFSSASDAAKRLEETKAVESMTPLVNHSHLDNNINSSAHAVQTAASHKPMSSASAAAAALESTRNRISQQPSTAAQSLHPSTNAKTAWTHPKPFMPNARPPARIPVDASWIATGGNTWSNKHRTSKAASAGNWAQQQAESAWGQPSHPTRPTRHSQPPPQRISQQYSQSGHHQRSSKQNQSWQGWGKVQRVESQETESSTDEEDTIHGGWGNGSDAWGGGGGGGGGWGNSSSNIAKGDKRGATGHKADGWGRDGGEWGGGGTGREEWKTAAAWGDHNDGWGQSKQTENNWGSAPGGGGASGWDQPIASGWGDTGGSGGEWGARANTQHEWGASDTQHIKAAFDASGGNKASMTAQERSQILNSLLNQAQGVKGSVPHVKQQARPTDDNWGAWEADETGWGSDSDAEGVTRRVHFSPKASELWGGSPKSVPNKTLVHQHQAQGITTTLINDASSSRFVESRGAAFAFVSNAFFGNARLARERIHWLFPSNKDERVIAMLAWVQKMSFNLGAFGLSKFLEHRERGALFVNAAFRMQNHPHEPAFDFLTFNQLQGTMDKVLQESVAFNDPASLVIVFVFLPSQTGNSVAIWRRKINVPDNARIKHLTEINNVVKDLRKGQEYVVMVDELPPSKAKIDKKPSQLRKPVPAKTATAKATTQKANQSNAAQKKRKWYKFFLG